MEKGNNKSKKNIINSVILVMIVVLLAAISALIVGSVLGSEAFSGSSGVGSEDLTALDNITAQDLSILSSHSTAVCTLTGVGNATGGEAITSGNYTQPTTCSIIATDGSEYLGEDWAINYTWTTPGNAGSVIDMAGLTTGFGGFISGIVTFLAVIGIIAGVIWLIGYIRPLFSRKDGIQGFDAN